MRIFQFSVLFLILNICVPSAVAQCRVTSLKVEHMVAPTTLETLTPRLSWVNEPSSPVAKGEYQTAYQIQVASSLLFLQKSKADVWDTGKRMDSVSYLVPYAGIALQSGQDYWFRVRTWNQTGQVSAWSEPSHWSMGLLNPEEWKAQWITAPRNAAAPLLRKTFSVGKKIKQAKLFISGLGYFESYINGKRVGNDYLVPNFSNYTERPDLSRQTITIENSFNNYRVLYLAYDVTNHLQQGDNAMGVILGNGFYDCDCHWVCSFGQPCLLCQLKITYTDGTEQLVTSNTTWKTHTSPIVKNGPYVGEVYDARLEIDDWSETTCDETSWTNAMVAQAPVGLLTAQSSPADKITEILQPQKIISLGNNQFEVTFNKEISGWIRLKNLKGRQGDTLQVKYVCESPLGVEQYIFGSADTITYAPRFTWYVFSKVVVQGLSSLNVSQIQAEAVNTDVPLCAEFSCSDTLLNKINAIWQRSQLDNMHGCIASDCPHRERSPYTGDGQAACSMVMSNFDVAAFYTKWIRDIQDAQNPHTGYVPNGAPWQPGCGGGVAWGAAMNIMPWEFYTFYGDRHLLEQNYVAMKNHISNMQQWQTKDGTMFQQMTNCQSDKIQPWLNLGDWSPAYELPSAELVHTFYYWLCLDYTARAANVIGDEPFAKIYAQKADDVRKAFHRKFFQETGNTYGDFGANVFALRMGVPEEVHDKVVQTLRNEIMQKYNGHINTGFLAARYLFEVLAQNGMMDVAYTILNKTDYPSFGYWIAQDATTTWEQWNGGNSRNHPMFGGGLVWLYRYLAGIQLDEKAPAYKHFYVHPILLKEIPQVNYALQTPYGKVSVGIRQSDSKVQYNITVPVGSSATLVSPKGDIYQLMQGTYQYEFEK